MTTHSMAPAAPPRTRHGRIAALAGAILMLSVGHGAAADDAGEAGAQTARSSETARPSEAVKPPEPARPVTRAEQLDQLFERLRKSEGQAEGAPVAARITEVWARSGSAVADLLAARAAMAMARDDAALAVQLLDRVIAIAPDWADAWRRRAAAFVQLDDFARAATDLHRALALEPRQFDALKTLGALFSAQDDDRTALRAWRRSLELNPWQPELVELVRKRAPDVDGRDL